MDKSNRMQREYTVLTSMCDFQGKVGIRNVFDILMDMAAAHAAELGVGYYDMLEKRCYWVAVRTRVKLYRRPILGDRMTVLTWPGKPGLAKSDRYYRIEGGGEVLAEGRTEWAVQDVDTGAVRRTDSYGYPLDMETLDDRVCEEAFSRFKNMEPGPEDLAGVYTVGSEDIDLGRHMNNVAYIRMLMGMYSTAEQAEMDISEVEISYRLGCYEGEQLHVYRRRESDGWFLQVQKENGDTAVHAKITLRQ